MIDLELFEELQAEAKRALQRHPRGIASEFAKVMPDGTGGPDLWAICQQVQALVDAKLETGTLTKAEIMLEEVLEVLSETDPFKLRAELIQVAHCALQWAATIPKKKKSRNI